MSHCGAIVVPGACPCRGGGQHYPAPLQSIDTERARCSGDPDFCTTGDTGATQKAAQHFRDRLNDLRQCCPSNPTLQRESGDTCETKKAAQRLSAIRR